MAENYGFFKDSVVTGVFFPDRGCQKAGRRSRVSLELKRMPWPSVSTARVSEQVNANDSDAFAVGHSYKMVGRTNSA